MIHVIGYGEKVEDSKRVKIVRHIEKAWFAENLIELFSNLETWVTNNVTHADRVNLHYTVGHTDNRSSRKFTSVDAIVFDVDGIQHSRINEYISVTKSTIGLPNGATIVSSGHGLHFIIHLKDPISAEKYIELRRKYVVICRKLEAEYKNKGLIGTVDNQVHRDTATLRLPLTKNVKFGHEDTDCTFVRERWEASDWNLEDYITDVVDTTDDPMELKSFPKPDNEGVLDCPFIKYCYENQPQVSEPEWYAMLTILARLDGGRELCHKYSNIHPSYNYAETETKIDQAIGSAGPRTCDNIHQLSTVCASICEACEFSVVSPISLRGANYIKTKDTGFHHVVVTNIQDPMGNTVKATAPGKPCKEDLMRYFGQLYPYKVVAEGKTVYVYEDSIWQQLSDTYIEAFAQKHYVPSPNAGAVSEFLKLIHRTNLVSNNWLNPSGLLNLRNGVLNLDTMMLLPHSKEYGFTYRLDYDYDPDALCPKFDRFMDEVTLDSKELSKVLMEFFGYCISNMECDHDKALILTGEGANGKSTLLDIISEVVGTENISGLAAEELKMDTKRVLIKDKLFNICDETPKKAFLDGSVFKNMVSGGLQTARQLYKQACVYKNRTKLIFTCNTLPISGDPTDGMFRRLIIVPFDAYFGKARRDPFIAKKIVEDERPGILMRIISGYKRVKRNGFSESIIVEEMVDQYKEDSDSVLWWQRDRIEMTNLDEDKLTLVDMYQDYKSYASAVDLFVQDIISFRRRISAIFNADKERKRVGGKRVTLYKGVKFIGGAF